MYPPSPPGNEKMANTIDLSNLSMLRPPIRPSYSRMSSRSSGRKTQTPTAQPDHALLNFSSTDAIHYILGIAEITSDDFQDKETLVKSFELASISDKAFAVKVARTLEFVKQWCKEIEEWQWSGTFEAAQVGKESGQNNGRSSGKDSPATNEYWGSIPRQQVLEYEDRLDYFSTQLEELDMEEQKSRTLKNVLETNSTQSTAGLVNGLDDLTNLMTTIVLQALPYYTRLMSILETWGCRIGVFQQISEYLEELERARMTREKVWLAIGVEVDSATGLRRVQSTKSGTLETFRNTFDHMRNEYEDRVAVLGQRIDTMLNILEGREDTLPDKWVDAVEELEIDYSSWTVEAGRKALQYEHQIDLTRRRQQRRDRTPSGELSNDAPEPVTIEEDLPHVPGAWEEDIEQASGAPEVKRTNGIELNAQENSITDVPSPNSLLYRGTPASGLFPRLVSTEYESAIGRFRPASEKGSPAHSQTISPTPSMMSRIRPLRTLPTFTPDLQAVKVVTLDPFKDQLSTTTSSNKKGPLIDPQCGIRLPSDSSSIKSSDESSMTIQSPENPSSTTFSTSRGRLTSNSNLSQSESKDYTLRTPGTLSPKAPPLMRVSLVKRQSTTTVVKSTSSAPSVTSEHTTQPTDPHSPQTPRTTKPGKGTTEDQLEQVIDKVLTTLPTRIHFKKQAYNTSIPASPKPRTPVQSKTFELHHEDSTSGLVLIPAYQKETRPSNLNQNSAIKLFYLIDGNKNPMKLFVRFVGESGRVVVRVGGGWADLAEVSFHNVPVEHSLRNPWLIVDAVSTRIRKPPPPCRLTGKIPSKRHLTTCRQPLVHATPTLTRKTSKNTTLPHPYHPHPCTPQWPPETHKPNPTHPHPPFHPHKNPHRNNKPTETGGNVGEPRRTHGSGGRGEERGESGEGTVGL